MAQRITRPTCKRKVVGSNYTMGKTFLIRSMNSVVLWYGAGLYLPVGLSTKLVNMLQTEPLKLGPSDLIL